MLTYHEKQIVSLRLSYMGGYSYFFKKKVFWLLDNGYEVEELKIRCVDDRMKLWLDDAIREYKP